MKTTQASSRAPSRRALSPVGALLALCITATTTPITPRTAAAAAPLPAVVATLSLQETDRLPSAWGTAFKATIASAILGEERTVNIYLPASFAKTKRTYPVIFLTDGEYYFERAALAARQLALAGHIPDCIVAAIETPNRRPDLTPPGMSASLSDAAEPRGELLLRFITEELRPQLITTMRAGAPSVLCGHSHGGILCHYAAAKWRNDFPFILALDAPIHLDHQWLAQQLFNSVNTPGALRLVSLEAKFGWSDADWSHLQSIAPAQWKLVRRTLDREDHESMVFAGFFEGLKELFSDFSQTEIKGLSPEDAFKHYESLTAPYGAAVTPPEQMLRHALMNLTAKGKADDARRALKALSIGYGESADIPELAAEINEAEAAMKGQETVEQLLALAPPTPAQIAPYLGVWRGESWLDLDADRKNPLIVTFSIKDGHALATIENPDAPPEFQHESVAYLRITPDAVEFGNMNGMFPPGVVARVAHLKDNTLSGESVFKGVYFKYPEGMTPPHHMFSLTRD